MKKISALLLILIILLIAVPQVFAKAARFRSFTQLQASNGAAWNDGDSVIIITLQDDATYPSENHSCTLDADSGAAESLPTIVSFTNNANNKRFLCERVDGMASGTTAGGDLTGTYPNPTLTTDVIEPAQMADADHGDVSWFSQVATVENVQCTGSCISDSEVDSDLTINSTKDITTTEDVIIGDACTSITPDGEDLCVDGDAGIDGDATVGGDLLIPTGNIKIGTGTPDPAQDGLDLYVGDKAQIENGLVVGNTGGFGGNAGIINIDHNFTPATASAVPGGLKSNITLAPTAPGAYTYSTVIGRLVFSTTNYTAGTNLIGGNFQLWGNPGETITDTDINITGIQSLIIPSNMNNTYGDLTPIRANCFSVGTLGGSITADNCYGVLIESPVDADFHPTNVYGSYIEDQNVSGATNVGGIVLANGDNCIWMSGMTGVASCSTLKGIAASQMNALNTTPIVVVAGKGADTVIEIESIMMIYDYVTAHTGVDATDEILFEYTAGTQAITQEVELLGFVDQTNNEARLIKPDISRMTEEIDTVALLNTGVQITGSATHNGTTSGANSITFKINYKIYVMGL